MTSLSNHAPQSIAWHYRELNELRDQVDDLAEQMHLDGVYTPLLLDVEVKLRAAWAALTEASTELRNARRQETSDRLSAALTAMHAVCADCGGAGRIRMDDGAYVQCVCQMPPALRTPPPW